MSTLKYREYLYQDYFNNQAGRRLKEDLQQKLRDDEYLFGKEILPLLPENKNATILDIGCGFGSLILALKNKGYKNATGIDVSEGQVKVAHELGLKEVIQADLIPYLQSHPNHFDVITGVDILEHFTKDELVEILLLIRSSLKENGMGIFRTPNLDGPFASLYANGDFTHENYLNSSSIRQVLGSTGYKNTQVLSSHVYVKGTLKEIIRKIVWLVMKIRMKLTIFATGRSSSNILFTPNMIITCTKS